MARVWMVLALAPLCGHAAEAQLLLTPASGPEGVGISEGAVAIDGSIAVVGAVVADVPGGAAGAGVAHVYRWNGQSWVYSTLLSASDGETSDAFGGAVAVSGDTVVVGAGGVDGSRGAAYVFQRSATDPDDWSEVAILQRATRSAEDLFGAAVDIHHDRIVVGAPGVDRGQLQNAGEVYLFERHEGGTDQWGEVDSMVPPVGESEEWLGTAVAVHGATVLAGAPYSGVGQGVGAKVGMAVVFGPSLTVAGEWEWVQNLVAAADPRPDEYFGYDVAVSENYAVVGSHRDENQGSVWFYERIPGTRSFQGQGRRSGLDVDTLFDFGHAVDLTDEIAAVGAPFARVDGTFGVGAVYLLARNQPGPNAWGQVAKIEPALQTIPPNPMFGWAVDLDGFGSLLVAWPGWQDGTGALRGAAYLVDEGGIFRDGFESGDTVAWSQSSP